ncbi:MAG: hypothetical protein E7649_07420 [Ruminococcaceae bacterium]|nr:hypothetical protein [Oscillospiraceae bacterium]
MENYGILKHLCTENAYGVLTKVLNSAKITEDTRKTMKRITRSDIRYSHMGQLIIDDGVCYATYLQNPGDDGEVETSVTSGVVLAVFDLERATADDFNVDTDVSYFPIGKQGEMCAGYRATSIFKDNSMCLVGRELYICFCFITEDGQSRMFCKSFNVDTRTWTRENEIMLRYENENHVFSNVTLNKIYSDKGLPQNAKDLIELVSRWSEYQGEYYATGVSMGMANNGFVVKTRDFINMELVDIVPFNDRGTAEIGSYIFKDKLYVACRQDYTVPYLYLGALDLKSMKWERHFKVPDGNCRPWFFEYNDNLYLMCTVDEMTRRYTNICRVRTWDTEWDMFNNIHPVEVMATIKECGYYFATASYGDDVYFVCTWNTESFGKLCLKFFNEDEINKKLIQMFE